MAAIHADVSDLLHERERAQSDYLAVSRSAHLYASGEDYRRAEERAWERLQAAQDAVARMEA